MLSENVITDVLLAALSTGGDFAEIFMEDTYSTQIRMLDGAVDEAVSGRDFGVGIRIFQGWQSVYAYTNDVSREGLIKTAREAAAALRGVPAGKTVVLARLAVEKFNPVRLEPRLVKHGDRVAVMKRAHLAAAGFHEQITQVAVNYWDVDQNVCIANSEGLLVEDRRVRTRLSINAVASKGQEKQSALSGPRPAHGL